MTAHWFREKKPRLVACALIALGIVLSLWLLPPLRHTIRFTTLLLQPMPDLLPVPVQGVHASQLRDSWGNPRSGGRKHKGIDIFAPRNTPIMSVTEGIVFKKDSNRLGGKFVTITGPRGYHHYYAHLESWGEVDEGGWIEKGQVIGTVGDSGNARGTPTHLHYGIYAPLGWAVNPYPYLKKEDRR